MLSPTMPRSVTTTSRIPTVTSKSYLRSEVVTNTKKAATTRTANYKTLAVDRASTQLAYFNQKPSTEMQNVDKATATCATECATKGELTL